MDSSIKHRNGPEITPDSQADMVYKVLRLDDWIPPKVLSHLTGIQHSSISGVLTLLRKTGWVEYKNMGGREFAYRRRAQWGPPQENIVNRTSRAPSNQPEPAPTIEQHLEQARFHISRAMEQCEEVSAIQKYIEARFSK